MIRPLFLFAVWALEPAAFGATKPGTTAAPILQTPTAARPVAMGTAFTAVANDLSAMHYNPAGLSLLNSKEASLHYLKGFEGQNVESLAFASPLLYRGILGMGYSTVAGALTFAQHGKLELNRTNPDGSFKDSRSISAGGDIVAAIGYAERVAETNVAEAEGFSYMQHYAGLNAKFIQSTLAETYKAQAFALDFGYLMRWPESGLMAGASILNAGSRMKFIEEEDPLPLTARAGVAYGLKRYVPGLLASLDGDYLSYEKEWHANVGLEQTINRAFVGRLGYRYNHDTLGPSIGFGIKNQGIQFDYAWVMAQDLSDTHRISITYRFGRLTQKEREQAREIRVERLRKTRLEDLEKKRPSDLDAPPRPKKKRSPKLPDRNQGIPGWIY